MITLSIVLGACSLIAWGAYELSQAPTLDANGEEIYGLQPVDFPERTNLIAEDQEEYKTLPAHHTMNEQGELITCWQMSFADRLKILFTGKLYVSVWTFYRPLQPLFLTVRKEHLFVAEKAEPKQDITDKEA